MQYARTGILAVLGFYLFFYLIGGVDATPFQEIPDGVDEGLFGGTNLFAAKMLLSASILLGIGLAMSVAGRKVNFLATVIVMLTVSSVLVTIGWLDFWVLIMFSILVLTMFGKAMADWVTGG